MPKCVINASSAMVPKQDSYNVVEVNLLFTNNDIKTELIEHECSLEKMILSWKVI